MGTRREIAGQEKQRAHEPCLVEQHEDAEKQECQRVREWRLLIVERRKSPVDQGEVMRHDEQHEGRAQIVQME